MRTSLLVIIFVAMNMAQMSGCQDYPKVAISFPDIADVDFVNSTIAFMSNSNPVFQMECNASYPVEWIIHYSEEDDGTSEKSKTVEVWRDLQDFQNVQSYMYRTKIRLEYNGKLLVFPNFSCEATQTNTDGLQTHVTMRGENKKSIILLEISEGVKDKFQIEPGPDTNENCSKAVATVSETEYLISCWTCETPNGQELELDYISCLSVTQCKSMHSRQNKKTKCLYVFANATEQKTECKIYSTVDYNPKAVVCKNYGPALAQFYFFGVFRGDIDDDDALGPPIYFDWSEVDPTAMLYIHPIDQDVYQGENISIICEYSRYYFAFGSWFGVQNDDGMVYIKAKDIKPCDTDVECIEAKAQNRSTKEDAWRGTYKAFLNTTFSGIGQHEVFCFGPVWNSTEWVNSSAPFYVKKGEAPEVLSITPNGDNDFIIGQRNRTLTCNFKGKPPPKVEWTGPSEKIYSIYIGKAYSQLLFSEIGFQTAGIYTCIVTSYLGKHSKSFKLDSHSSDSSLSPIAISAIVVACLGIALIVTFVIARMTRIIKQQREALRILTEAEIQEFVEGNPELIKRTKAQTYFDNALVIDALPYDQKYEIPEEKLSIDHSSILGIGQFGMVLKGKVQLVTASQYVNVALLDIDAMSPGETLTVAVKVCKKDVDVTNFKTLLAEIKVMAYLGHHSNLVNLIGAHTQNIRNRELCIALEYCENGSLESYLRRNKNKFHNKVKYGFLSDDGSSSITYTTLVDESGLDYVSQSQRCVFSTLELLKWIHDIAEAVEYMHGNRVIHGDLATRNVLLTKEFTAKVADFGLSRQLIGASSYTKQTHCPLPWRHMAIESLKNLEFSVKSDMWALAMTYWELFTLGEVPYAGVSYSQEFMRELEEEGMRPIKPPFATNDIYEFMLMCWSRLPEDRPTTAEIKLISNKLLRQAS